ncbi:MAG: hypothetical protein ACI9HY_002908 [Planctomycetaceae bacterium]|jgi:hypothetical protein
MSETSKGQLSYSIVGVIFLAIGLAVFAIRLLHEGPYALPGGAAFIGALLAIALGTYLLWPGKPRFTGLVAIVVATFASFPAIYSIVGETEEVISLYAIGPESNLVDLRLWIVDRSDGAWVGMGRSKAVTHNLDGARLDMLRGGETICVIPALAEDRATVSEIHKMKVDKYKAAQISASIGMYPTEASENTVALRLDPCNS